MTPSPLKPYLQTASGAVLCDDAAVGGVDARSNEPGQVFVLDVSHLHRRKHSKAEFTGKHGEHDSALGDAHCGNRLKLASQTSLFATAVVSLDGHFSVQEVLSVRPTRGSAVFICNKIKTSVCPCHRADTASRLCSLLMLVSYSIILRNYFNISRNNKQTLSDRKAKLL